MDIWISRSDQNIGQLMEALRDFGGPDGIDRRFFKEKGNAFRIGSPPIQVEFITEVSGIDFEASYSNRVTIEVDRLQIRFIGYNELVKNKRASGRLRDLADLEGLGEN